MSTSRISQELASLAADHIIEGGMDYGAAKERAARTMARRGGVPRAQWPSNSDVEAQVRERLALFHADEQPRELAALRAVARRWMLRLAAWQPHVSGAVWRGTATLTQAVRLDLYADDPKSTQIALIDAGVRFDLDAQESDGRNARGDERPILVVSDRTDEGEPVVVVLTIHDRDALRGALLPDGQGQTWRGDLDALERRMQDAEPPPAHHPT